MERRVLLAVFLSFLVLFTYQLLFVPPEPPPAEPGPGTTSQSATPEAAETAPRPDTAAPAPTPPAAADAVVSDNREREIVVDTSLARAVFSSRGARLVSWRLKRYLDAQGAPLELIPPSAPPTLARPFSLVVEDAALSARLNDALFRPSAEQLSGDGPLALTFEYEEASGLRARKEFRFDGAQPYVVRFSTAVERNGQPLNPTVSWGTGLSGGADAGGYMQAAEAIFLRDGDVERLGADDVREEPVYEGTFDFAGVDDHYFLAATQPEGPIRVEYEATQVRVVSDEGATEQGLVGYRVRFAEPPTDVPFFFGPKDFDVLASVDRELTRSINFGIFAFLVVPLLRSLKWINGFVGNYGWSIIILTILINAAMFPLRHKSVVSMRRMQEIQPEVKAIQDRYAKLKMTDPARQKMNVEVMNLYRERGVNPASGCVPMLLTMPVLFAFYSLLSVAIEIRGEPFVLWIDDLSTYDPLYVTPLLMGASMVWQQKITPTTADPTQQKVMMLMPIVFTFMFLWVPSGLVLYWLVSNLWGIAQQQVTNRLIGPPAVRTVRPPAERRVRRVGSGKTAGVDRA